MNYALIGCGRIAINHVYAAKNNHLNFVALCDVRPEKMDALLTRGELDPSTVVHYTNYKKMLDEHPEIELVSIATESGYHAEIALECIRRGIHVIIEKPMAMSLADADRIIALAEEKHVKVSACHQNRFNVAIQHVRDAMDEVRFGRLSHGTIHVR